MHGQINFRSFIDSIIHISSLAQKQTVQSIAFKPLMLQNQQSIFSRNCFKASSQRALMSFQVLNYSQIIVAPISLKFQQIGDTFRVYQFAILHMFDQDFCLYNENSLDILLKFTSHEDLEQHSPSSSNVHSYLKENFQTQDILPMPNQLFCEIPIYSQPEPDAQVQKMREACFEQEAKVRKLSETAELLRPKLTLTLSRKASQCTQAPSSPLRKTKMVKKDKQ